MYLKLALLGPIQSKVANMNHNKLRVTSQRPYKLVLTNCTYSFLVFARALHA